MATKKAKNKRHLSYTRDVYLAYLIDGARRTLIDGFPIIEDWMVADKPPKFIVQWDRRKDVINPNETGISFYCNDPGFTPILNNPKAYTDKLNKYYCIIGFDASPYDNMPLVVQKSQIYLNLGLTYYYGRLGNKIIPNVRLGDMQTLPSLDAYPHNTLISVGTNGFVRELDNREIFKTQIKEICDKLHPSGILVYGPDPNWLFEYPKELNIPIYQYNSFTMDNRTKIHKLEVYK